MPPKTKTWRSYEDLARYVLMYFAETIGISEVEAKQRLDGASGTQWEIDAKGVLADGSGFLVVECRERSAAQLNQNSIGSLAFIVQDTGAKGAIIVTSIGLQKGAKKVAEHKGFHVVFLPKKGTFEQFFASCGNRLVQGVSDRASNHLSISSFVVFQTETK